MEMACFVSESIFGLLVTANRLAVKEGPPKRSVNSSSAESPSSRIAVSTSCTVLRTWGCASAWRLRAARLAEKSKSEWRRVRMGGKRSCKIRDSDLESHFLKLG